MLAAKLFVDSEVAGDLRDGSSWHRAFDDLQLALDAAALLNADVDEANDIDSIWIETSIPYELLLQLLRREDLELPENVERINLKSRVEAPRKDKPQAKKGGRRGSRRRKRKR